MTDCADSPDLTDTSQEMQAQVEKGIHHVVSEPPRHPLPPRPRLPSTTRVYRMDTRPVSQEKSPRKKRCPPDRDENTCTPKKLRTLSITQSSNATTNYAKSNPSDLPDHLLRLQAIQTGLQHALSHALATCGVSPTADTGIVRNVVNHFSLATYTGLPIQFTIDDLRRMCWVWEWDAVAMDSSVDAEVEDDNPFLDTPSTPKIWTRGSMGVIISPTTHFMKAEGKRVHAYGIGIEVEMDLDKDMQGGMAAIARWTTDSNTRNELFMKKLERWRELNSDISPIPEIPLATLPKLCSSNLGLSSKRSTISQSLKKSSSISQLPTPGKSPSKQLYQQNVVPFPCTPSKTKAATIFPQTPSLSKQRMVTALASGSSEMPSPPLTPAKSDISHNAETPATSRRQALYERIRQRSLSPSKNTDKSGKIITRDQMLKMSQEETRRRCLMGRLGGVAESVWMLFLTPTSGTSTPHSGRKRRALPLSEVVNAVIKSSPVPISSAEAIESLDILGNLCPFFIKPLKISGEEWLEMPASLQDANNGDTMQSPGAEADSVTYSPRRVKKEGGGIREVREIIRREIESQD